jgi:hypothetical protein
MPRTKISEFSATAADNTDIDGINLGEGMLPSDVNNAIRELMAQLKDLQAGTSGDTIPITAGGTGATTASAARTALGLAIGTNVQAFDADTTKNDVANTFTANQIVSVTDNSNAALRITQLGTGNALLVEDSTNPDASPFVINSNGTVIVGTAQPQVTYGSSVVPVIQLNSTSAIYAGVSRWANNAASSGFSFAKSRGTSVGTRGAVVSGDTLGQTLFDGDDGTSFILAASIAAAVDGTPGTNDMPGRLVFSTTPDGSATPTERMRIDNAGRVGIGGTPPAGWNVLLGKSITGAASSFGFVQSSAVLSDVTNAFIYSTSASTQATSFTLSGLYHYRAAQATIGAGSTVTNQYGFFADSNVTGATNNYGFYSNIASGTGRWNFYAAGTAANYFAGNVGIGTTTTTNKLEIGGSGDSLMRLLAAGQANGLEIGQLTANGSSKIFAANNNFLALGTNNTERMRIDATGNVLVTSAGGLGYGTGSGGAVTQATSRTTGVTLNKTNGAITLVSAAGLATYQSFTVTNSTVAATDVIHVCQKSGTDKYIILVTAVAAGSFQITFATTGGITTEQPVFNFAVMKAVTA